MRDGSGWGEVRLEVRGQIEEVVPLSNLTSAIVITQVLTRLAQKMRQ